MQIFFLVEVEGVYCWNTDIQELQCSQKFSGERTTEKDHKAQHQVDDRHMTLST